MRLMPWTATTPSRPTSSGTVTVTNGLLTVTNATGAKNNKIDYIDIIQVPPVPSGLTATGAESQVSLTWLGSGGTTTYNVYRGTSTGGEGATPIATGLTT